MINNQFNIGELLSKKFHTSTLILTNGNNIICYDSPNKKIMIYNKLGAHVILFKKVEKFIDKFSKIGLVLKETYEAEEKAVKQVFGQYFNLHYNM